MNKLPPLSYYYRNKIPLHERGKGYLRIGDSVTWLGRKGKIVEIVPYGMYPKKHPSLKVKGYYREFESYIVADSEGRRYWPRVGNLKKV